MQIDLQTLWYLTVGTLLVSASLLLWERQAHPGRAGVLAALAAGLFAFVLGCVVAMTRSHFPVALGMGVTNILMMSGYLLVFNAAAGLDGRQHFAWSVGMLGVLALVWMIVGTHFPFAFWNHVSALPIALTCGLTAWTLLRSRTVRGLRSRPVAVSVSTFHALFYLGRAFVAPVLVQWYGPDMLAAVAQMTMYEAVLYSVAMPMSFLALVREEDRQVLLRMSHTDQLTGLANRHAFFERGGRILEGRRGTDPISLLAFDLDHFKAINDRYGHPVGDEVLKLFADTARKMAGPDALLVRLRACSLRRPHGRTASGSRRPSVSASPYRTRTAAAISPVCSQRPTARCIRRRCSVATASRPRPRVRGPPQPRGRRRRWRQNCCHHDAWRRLRAARGEPNGLA
jgi:hypothetical protein